MWYSNYDPLDTNLNVTSFQWVSLSFTFDRLSLLFRVPRARSSSHFLLFCFYVAVVVSRPPSFFLDPSGSIFIYLVLSLTLSLPFIPSPPPVSPSFVLPRSTSIPLDLLRSLSVFFGLSLSLSCPLSLRHALSFSLDLFHCLSWSTSPL